MTRLGKVRTIADIKDLVTLDPVTVSAGLVPAHPLKGKAKSKHHKEAISKGQQEYYAGKDGVIQRHKMSAKMKQYYQTDKGKQHIEHLKSQHINRERLKAHDKETRLQIVAQYKSGKTITKLAGEWSVSRATIYRYLKELT